MGTSNFPKIAFIGVGVMGREMVRHLITAGYPVKIYDISSDAISALAEQGALLRIVSPPRYAMHRS